MKYPADIMSEVLFTQEQIVEKAKELAERINQDYNGKPLTVVCTLKGATFFFADLMKYINIDCQIEFIKASSYIGNTTMTIGNVQISNVMNFPIENRDILIVEDIVDTGLTCQKLFKYFEERNCSSVNVCTLLDKPSRRKVEIVPKYAGYSIDDHFVIGYGLDYNESYRNIPCVGIINKKYI
jgi:hypoxanthine phosphoribosyltransferase